MSSKKQLSKARLKQILKLHQKKFRASENLFLAEGKRTVTQILANLRISCQCLILDASYAQEYEAMCSSYETYIAESGDFSELSDTVNSQGLLGLFSIPEPANIDILINQFSGSWLVTDAIQDPGNLGTLLRTATWFGIDGLILGEGSVDLYNPKTVRATAGAIGSLPYIYANLSFILPLFKEHGWHVAGLNLDIKSIPLEQFEPHHKQLLIIGNEANGISKSTMPFIDEHLLISSVNHNNENIESLNATIAGSIAIYHIMKNSKNTPTHATKNR